MLSVNYISVKLEEKQFFKKIDTKPVLTLCTFAPCNKTQPEEAIEEALENFNCSTFSNVYLTKAP